MSQRDFTVLGSSSQVPTRYRNHNGYLLRWDGQGVLFDPGEGTQRQFLFAGLPPTVVTRICITHFHGDHCLGLAGMFQRLSLDRVSHAVHIYFPASGIEYVQRMRRASIYHDVLDVVLHPIERDGVIDETDEFTIEARRLVHPVDTFGYRFIEPERRRFDKAKLEQLGLSGPIVGRLQQEGIVTYNGKTVKLEEVSLVKRGAVFAFILDTRPCVAAAELAEGADFLVMEGTFLSEHFEKAIEYGHCTVKETAETAAAAGVGRLLMTHFSQRYTDAGRILAEARDVFPDTLLAKDLLRIPLRT